MKKKAIILTLITLASLAITVCLWFAMRDAQVDYTEVEVIVDSARTVTYKGQGSSTDTYEVMVNYNDKIYELHNCHNSYSYVPETKITAYLSNGKLYANLEGVQTSSPVATVYFIFLFATLGMVLGFPIYLSKLKERENG